MPPDKWPLSFRSKTNLLKKKKKGEKKKEVELGAIYGDVNITVTLSGCLRRTNPLKQMGSSRIEMLLRFLGRRQNERGVLEVNSIS